MTTAELALISDEKIRASIERAIARNALAGLADETVVESELAALYLGISLSTLRRIVAGGELKPTKNPESGSTAFNQKALFEMGELRRWRDKNKAGGVAEQALLRGLGFQTISDLAIEQPFWTRRQSRGESIIGHGLTLPPEIVDGLLSHPEVGVDWLTWEQALSRPWESLEQRELFQPHFVACLQHALGAVEAGNVATQMFVGIAEAQAVSAKEGL